MSNYSRLLIHRLLVDSLLLLCFSTFVFGDNRLADDEVQALGDIAKTPEKKDWNFEVDPCSGSEYGWITPPGKYYENNVTCGNCMISDAANATSTDQICHVVSIVLKAQSLPGKLPPELIRLPYLQEIRNYLNGTIPWEWSSLPLVSISLVGNRLTGSIPGELANITTLQSLAIDFNNFSGVLPASLGNLPKIERIVIQASGLMGPIPSGISFLTRLTDLMLRNCNITGQLPEYLGVMTNLKTLDLAQL